MRRWPVCLLAMFAACRQGPAALPDAGPPEVAVECERLIPASVRQAQLAEWSPAPLTRPAVSASTACLFAHGEARLTVLIDCHREATAGELHRARDLLLSRDGVELPHLGRLAVRAVTTGELEQLTAWDSDTPCVVTSTWLGEGHERTTDFVRAVLEALNATTLDGGATPAGEQSPPAAVEGVADGG